MKRLKFYSLVFALIFFVLAFLFALKPSGELQLIFMGVFAGLVLLGLVSGITGIAHFPRAKIRAFIPAAICFAGILLGLFVATGFGRMVRQWRFQKNLPHYMEIVRRVETGEIKTGVLLSKLELPEQYSHLAYASLAKTNFFGGATIEFLIGGGFPVKHSGFLYISTGSIEADPEMLERWPRNARINEKWFAIGD